jgi:integrase
LFTTHCGTSIKPSNPSSSWSDFVKRKGLEPPIRLHDLRHSYAADLILEQREPVKLLSELLGHEDPAITASIYLHTDQEMHKRAGIRQNGRIAASVEAQKSQVNRDNVVQLAAQGR